MTEPAPHGAPELDLTTSAAAATAAIADIARDLHRGAPPDVVLDRVVTTAADVIASVDHAAVTVVRDRLFTTAAASDPLPRAVDEIQYAMGEGPCLDAVAEDYMFHSTDLREERRWPRFATRTVAETPIRSILSFRLFAEDDVLGALNFYSVRPGSFAEDHQQQLCSVFATHAALALSRSLERLQLHNIQESQQRNRTINVAVGVAMVRYGRGRDDAFELLRRRSRDERRSLLSVCSDLVTDTEHDTARGNDVSS